MNRKLMFVFAGLFVASGFVIAGNLQADPAKATGLPPAATKKAEEQFKNIQVLKGIPAEQIIPTMQFISASLGVECDFCHVQGAFDKDDKKPKQAARKMIEMMFAINKDNFEGHREVTCYSCHRGSTNPKAIPAVMGEGSADMVDEFSRIEEPTKPNTGPTADQLLEKYLQASGGSAAIDKIATRVMKGTISFGEKSFPIDIYCKHPEKRVSFTHMPEGDSVTAFDGHDGWLGMAGRPVREMHGGDLDGAAMDADLHFAADLKQMVRSVRVLGSEKIGADNAFVVVGEREGKPQVRLFFDEKTGLLVRLLRFGDSALGLLPTQIDYADYRAVDGVQVPFRWTLARPSGLFTIQVSEMQQNVPVDDARFVKPPAPAPDSGKAMGR